MYLISLNWNFWITYTIVLLYFESFSIVFCQFVFFYTITPFYQFFNAMPFCPLYTMFCHFTFYLNFFATLNTFLQYSSILTIFYSIPPSSPLFALFLQFDSIFTLFHHIACFLRFYANLPTFFTISFFVCFFILFCHFAFFFHYSAILPPFYSVLPFWLFYTILPFYLLFTLFPSLTFFNAILPF